MKRYAVFAGEQYYPLGGWDDHKGSYETLDEATTAANNELYSHDWAHVIDLRDGTQAWRRMEAITIRDAS